jgi:dUTP pyrophosphatase
MTLTLKIIRLDKELPLPKFALPGDAAMDLYAGEKTTIAPGERVQVKTGLKMEIPAGYAGFVWDKSGLSQKSGLKTLGGVIDSGYRGEVLVGMINLSTETYIFEKGHKIAQMCIQKIEQVEVVEVESLSESVRGEGGFGSTGK